MSRFFPWKSYSLENISAATTSKKESIKALNFIFKNDLRRSSDVLADSDTRTTPTPPLDHHGSSLDLSSAKSGNSASGSGWDALDSRKEQQFLTWLSSQADDRTEYRQIVASGEDFYGGDVVKVGQSMKTDRKASNDGGMRNGEEVDIVRTIDIDKKLEIMDNVNIGQEMNTDMNANVGKMNTDMNGNVGDVNTDSEAVPGNAVNITEKVGIVEDVNREIKEGPEESVDTSWKVDFIQEVYTGKEVGISRELSTSDREEIIIEIKTVEAFNTVREVDTIEKDDTTKEEDTFLEYSADEVVKASGENLDTNEKIDTAVETESVLEEDTGRKRDIGRELSVDDDDEAGVDDDLGADKDVDSEATSARTIDTEGEIETVEEEGVDGEVSVNTEGGVCSGSLENETGSSFDSAPPLPGYLPNEIKISEDTASPFQSSEHASGLRSTASTSQTTNSVFVFPGLASDPGYGTRSSSLDDDDFVFEESRLAQSLSKTTSSELYNSAENGDDVQRERQEALKTPPTDSDDRSSRSTPTGVEVDRKPSALDQLNKNDKLTKNKKGSHNSVSNKRERQKKGKGLFAVLSASSSSDTEVGQEKLAGISSGRGEYFPSYVNDGSSRGQLFLYTRDQDKVIAQQNVSSEKFARPSNATDDIVSQEKPLPRTETISRKAPIMKETLLKVLPVRPQLSQETAQAASYMRQISDKPLKDGWGTNSLSTTPVESCPENNFNDASYFSYESIDGVSPASPEITWQVPELVEEDSLPWSFTVDKKKFADSEITRQDAIWDLINTEKLFVKRLKIMQQIFVNLMLRDLNYSEDQVDRLFPRLNEIVDLHSKFLNQLVSRQSKNKNKYIDEIGDILLNQFQGSSADNMKTVYGVYCSKYPETLQFYKELSGNDKKFQEFTKYCHRLPMTAKLGIKDFILVVSQRLTTYPLLIEMILKNTKDRRDRAVVSQALLSCKNIIQHVDGRVAAYNRLVDIQSRMDQKTVSFMGKKFKRQDLNVNNREFVYAGKIGWKSAQRRVYDILAVVLTDIVVFLQTSEQNYTFLLQDNKACVIPLRNLLVKENGDRKSNGIFIINQDKAAPEMYELVCQNKAEQQKWVQILQKAIRHSPSNLESKVLPVSVLQSTSNAELVAFSSDFEKNGLLDHANKVKHIIEQLQQKDKVIRECCEEKNKLMLELYELSARDNKADPQMDSQDIDSWRESIQVVQAAIQEATHLTELLHGKEHHLKWSISSEGERRSSDYHPTSVPKRGETFSGFHSHSSRAGEVEVGSQSFLRQETPENRLKSQYSYVDPPWNKSVGSSISSSQSLLEEVAPLSPVVVNASNMEQMTSVLHLVQYLNAIMNVTSRQSTKVERLRSELAMAKGEIAKLSADMHNHGSVYPTVQLIELRSIQEQLRQEKEEWERTKLHDRSQLEDEKQKIKYEWREIEQEKMSLRRRIEDIKNEQELLLEHIKISKERGFSTSSSRRESLTEDDLEKLGIDSSSQQQSRIVHFKSASADYYETGDGSKDGNPKSSYPYSWGSTKRGSLKSNPSIGIREDLDSTPFDEQTIFPFHLIDAYGSSMFSDVHSQSLLMDAERRSRSNTPDDFQHQPTSALVNSPDSHSQMPSSLVRNSSSRTSVRKASRVQSMSAISRSARKQANSGSIPADLSHIAETKEIPLFSAPSENSYNSPTLSNKSSTTPEPSNDLLYTGSKGSKQRFDF